NRTPLLLTTPNKHPLPFKPINKNPRKPNTPLWWPDRKPAKRALFGGCSGGAGGGDMVSVVFLGGDEESGAGGHDEVVRMAAAVDWDEERSGSEWWRVGYGIE
nr:hypothetical protein [Tanacetum cinerariifolium]